MVVVLSLNHTLAQIHNSIELNWLFEVCSEHMKFRDKGNLTYHTKVVHLRDKGNLTYHTKVVHLKTELRNIVLVIHHSNYCFTTRLLLCFSRFQVSLQGCCLRSQGRVFVNNIRCLSHTHKDFSQNWLTASHSNNYCNHLTYVL